MHGGCACDKTYGTSAAVAKPSIDSQKGLMHRCCVKGHGDHGRSTDTSVCAVPASYQANAKSQGDQHFCLPPYNLPTRTAAPHVVLPARALTTVRPGHRSVPGHTVCLRGLFRSGSCPQSQRGMAPTESPAHDAERNTGETVRTPGSPGAKRSGTTEVTQTQR